MARIHLVTGGARSGKSGYAQALAEFLPGPRVYVATCPVLDDEMRARVERHRADRAGKGWETLEETIDLVRVLREADAFETVLVDCLTLWVNNLQYTAEQAGRDLEEDEVAAAAEEMLRAAKERDEGDVIFVTNEVGLGIVPENALPRRFRDLSGRCNQTVADGAERVTLLVCGQPLHIKGDETT